MSRRRNKAITPQAPQALAIAKETYMAAANLILREEHFSKRQDTQIPFKSASSLDLSATIKDGKISWDDRAAGAPGEVAMDEYLSWSGVPFNFGTTMLEQNPDLNPYAARGLASNPGVWWDLKNTPEVAAPLNRLVDIVSTTPLRLDRPILPDFATDADHANAEMQYLLASRWFYEWETTGLNEWVADLLQVAPVSGFILGEKTATTKQYTINGRSINCLCPEIPKSIMPWSVRYWLTNRGNLDGVLFDFSQSSDYSGDRGSYQYIPAEKLLLVRNRPLANNFEGESMMRSCYNQIEQLRMLYQLQALGAEVHSLGELWFTQEAAGASNNAVTALSTGDTVALLNIIRNRQAAYVPGSVLPPGVNVVYGQANANLPDLTPMIENLRQAIALAMGSDDLLIAFQQAGSYAAKQTASEDKNKSLEALVETLVARPLESYIKQFLALAYPGEDIWAPKIIWGQIEERDLSTWLDNVAKAKSSGLLDDPIIGPQIRDELGLPQLEVEPTRQPLDNEGDPGDAKS